MPLVLLLHAPAPSDAPEAFLRTEHRGTGWKRALVCSTLAAFLGGCGGGDPVAPRTARRALGAADGGYDPHDEFASAGLSCVVCHPCGAAPVHSASWMDRSSSGFHAFTANAGLQSCQDCHGASLDGTGGSAAISCAACHGAAWKTSCAMCHGGANDATGAPPKTTWGNAGDPVRTGAHQRHLARYDCSACHVKPGDALAPGHLDGPTATVTFGGLSAQGTSPSWNRSSATCAATYCHGGTLLGGTHATPVWTVLDGTQRTCDSCHGAPPANASHTRTDGDCSACHGAGYSAAQATVGAGHIDGTLDVTLSCTSCHGDAARAGASAAAPPAGTNGETATTARAVGAHQRHLLGGPMTNPIACSECHAVPTSNAHPNGAVTVSFGPLARAGGAAPAWNRAANTCSATWCHGGKLTGGSRTAPVWTTVNGTQARCGTCHGLPPRSGEHGEDEHRQVSCSACHGGTYSSSAADRTLHLNGLLDVRGSRIRSWNPTTRRCSPTCHETESWGSSGGD